MDNRGLMDREMEGTGRKERGRKEEGRKAATTFHGQTQPVPTINVSWNILYREWGSDLLLLILYPFSSPSSSSPLLPLPFIFLLPTLKFLFLSHSLILFNRFVPRKWYAVWLSVCLSSSSACSLSFIFICAPSHPTIVISSVFGFFSCLL